MTDFKPQAATLEAGRGHEPDDLRIRSIVALAVALAGVIMAVLAALALLMGNFTEKEHTAKAMALPRFSDLAPAFPPPRLQADPAAEWIRLKSAADEQLKSYGWIDRQAGIAHIPIDRAIAIIAKSGIPPSELPRPGAETPDAKVEALKPRAPALPEAKARTKSGSTP
jgi:hypothetical protein